MVMTLAKINNMLPEDGCKTETCRSKFSVNFNVNFNVLLNKCILHPLVKKKDFNNLLRDFTVKLSINRSSVIFTAEIQH
jgi:hypothetical protein